MSTHSYNSQSEARDAAKSRAHYGHKDMIMWQDKGAWYTAVKSAATIKRAMLATGTQRTFMLYCKNDGQGMIINWPIANIMRCNCVWAERRGVSL